MRKVHEHPTKREREREVPEVFASVTRVDMRVSEDLGLSVVGESADLFLLRCMAISASLRVVSLRVV